MIAASATLILGVVIGYLGQRSRLCFTSGFRDYYLIRDTGLLKGVLGVLVGGVVGFTAVRMLGGAAPSFPVFLADQPSIGLTTVVIAVASGLGLGLVAAMAGGCPYRMHVLAGEGRKSSWYYLAGFYAGIIFFDLFTSRLAEVLAALGR